MHVVLQIVLLGLFIFAALAYGAVHYWAYSIVYGVTFVLCAVVLLQMGFSSLRRGRLNFGGGAEKKENPPQPPFEKGGRILIPSTKKEEVHKKEEELHKKEERVNEGVNKGEEGVNKGEEEVHKKEEGVNKREEGVKEGVKKREGEAYKKEGEAYKKEGIGYKKWGNAYAVFLGLFMLFVLFQLAPLPEGVIKALSPYTAYLYDQAHTLTAPDQAPTLTAPDQAHTLTAPDQAHTLTAPDQAHTLTAPDQAHSLTAPDVAEPAGRLLGYLTLDRDKTLKSLLALAAYLGFGFLLARTIRTSRDVKLFSLVLIVFSAGLSVYGLLSLLNASPKLAGWKNPLLQGARVTATLVNPDHFAAYLVLSLYLTVGYLAALLMNKPQTLGRTRRQRLLSLLNAEGAYIPKAFTLLFVIAVLIVVLFYTLSRGAVIGLAGSLLFCLLLLFVRTRRPLFLLLMLLPIGFIVYYTQVLGVEPLLQRLEDTRREMLEFEENVRVQSYRVGLELWQRFPWFGGGLGSFEVVFPWEANEVYKGLYVPYLHNDWLQLLVETGLIGSALFILAAVTLFVGILWRWWWAKDRWALGFGLAAMGAIIGEGIHAFVDFGLRIPVNSIFLALIVTLALTTLDEGFARRKKHKRRGFGAEGLQEAARSLSRKQHYFWIPTCVGMTKTGEEPVLGQHPGQSDETGKGSARRKRALARPAAAAGFILGGALCLWSALLVGRDGLAQHNSPSEINTVGEREGYGVNALKIQKALQLNPLNGDNWITLAMYAEVPGSMDTLPGEEEEGGVIDPRGVPGWESLSAAYGSLVDYAYAQALARSPAAGEYWIAYAEYLGENLRNEFDSGEITATLRLKDRAIRCYDMAVNMQPGNSSVRKKAGNFLGWLKQKGLSNN